MIYLYLYLLAALVIFVAIIIYAMYRKNVTVLDMYMIVFIALVWPVDAVVFIFNFIKDNENRVVIKRKLTRRERMEQLKK